MHSFVKTLNWMSSELLVSYSGYESDVLVTQSTSAELLVAVMHNFIVFTNGSRQYYPTIYNENGLKNASKMAGLGPTLEELCEKFTSELKTFEDQLVAYAKNTVKRIEDVRTKTLFGHRIPRIIGMFNVIRTEFASAWKDPAKNDTDRKMLHQSCTLLYKYASELVQASKTYASDEDLEAVYKAKEWLEKDARELINQIAQIRTVEVFNQKHYGGKLTRRQLGLLHHELKCANHTKH